jgi:hypothetical protein
MKELKKKPDTEMLIVHKPPMKADPDKAGREGGDHAQVRAMTEELEVMRKRLAQARDAGEKRRLIAEIQRRFGNEKAAQLVHEARHGGEDDVPPPARKGKP